MADDGHAVWCDLDSVAFGPREWDLVPAAFGLLRFGRDPSNYAQFANAYGFDVMSDARMPSPAEVVLMILVPPAGML